VVLSFVSRVETARELDAAAHDRRARSLDDASDDQDGLLPTRLHTRNVAEDATRINPFQMKDRHGGPSWRNSAELRCVAWPFWCGSNGRSIEPS
jgi:hypothetical protein